MRVLLTDTPEATENYPSLELGDGEVLVGDNTKEKGVKSLASNVAGGIVKLDEDGKLPAVDGSQLTGIATGVDPWSIYEAFEDFVDLSFVSSIGKAIGPFGFAGLYSGTGATVDYSPPIDGSEIGIAQISNGTAANSYGLLYTYAPDFITLGKGIFTYKARVYISALSTIIDTYRLRIGLNDHATGLDGPDALLFRQTNAVNGGNWELVSRSNDVETVVNSIIPAVAGAWIDLKIVVNADASSVEFFINDVSAGVITTNIPSGAARCTGLGFSSTRTFGITNNRDLFVDLVKLKYQFTTPR